MKKLSIIIPLAFCMFLTACSGARIYSIGVHPSTSDKKQYELVGSTHVNELNDEDAIPQIEKGIASVCPDGGSIVDINGEIIKKSEMRSFLLYKAIIQCNE